MKLRIMTYNIAAGRSFEKGPDYRPIIHAELQYADQIKELAPDICGLNEVDYRLPRSARVKMAKMIGDAAGYASAFAPAVTWTNKWGIGTYGNGFLSKHPIKDVEIYPIPNPELTTEPKSYEPRVILHAVVDFGGRDVDVFVTHVGLSDEEKKNAAQTITTLVSYCTNPVIVMGDFNMKQDNPMMQPLLSMLEDSFKYYPNQDDFTWPCDPELLNADPSKCERIDYILFSKHFKIESVEIPVIHLSDHKPYIANVELLEEAEG